MKEVYFAPGNAAMGVFLRAFPTAGANVTGLAVDFEGERGDPKVVKEAKEYFASAGWSKSVDGKLVIYRGTAQ